MKTTSMLTANMATVQNVDVIFNKFKVIGIFTVKFMHINMSVNNVLLIYSSL